MVNKAIQTTAEWLTAIGGLNWGLTVFDFNLVEYVAGFIPITGVETVVYSAVGISAAYMIAKMLKLIK